MQLSCHVSNEVEHWVRFLQERQGFHRVTHESALTTGRNVNRVNRAVMMVLSHRSRLGRPTTKTRSRCRSSGGGGGVMMRRKRRQQQPQQHNRRLRSNAAATLFLSPPKEKTSQRRDGKQPARVFRDLTDCLLIGGSEHRCCTGRREQGKRPLIRKTDVYRFLVWNPVPGIMFREVPMFESWIQILHFMLFWRFFSYALVSNTKAVCTSA